MQYRHEVKHRITPQDRTILLPRLQTVMQVDPFARNGQSVIRSLYFDTPDDQALWEKLEGVDPREKFRIRMYNHDPSDLKLEKKCKVRDLCLKLSVPLTTQEAQRILSGDTAWMRDDPRPLIQELYRKMSTRFLRPKTIVDYVREPYAYKPGNVRVTIDSDIRTGLTPKDFFDPHCPTVPIPDMPIILEVKWDEYLPDIIRQTVRLPGRRAGAFSKYAQCRFFG